MEPELLEIALEDIQKWDSRLVDLVKNDEVNPWDINISLLTDKYLELINHMETLDFRIPGNAVLTASVLLRLKSDHMDWQKKVEVERTKEDIDWDELPIPELKPVRRVVERKVTVLELVDALNDAFEVEKRRMSKRIRISEFVEISRFEIGELLEKLGGHIDSLEGSVHLADFVDGLPEEEFAEYDEAYYFLALLHLCTDGELELEQEGWNAPIYISKPRGEKVEK